MADRSRDRSASRSRSRSRDPEPAVDDAAPADPVDGANSAVSNMTDDAANGAGGAANGANGGEEGAAPVELYIGNLAFQTRDLDLEDEFKKEAPDLISAQVVMQKFDPSKSRGFAFVKLHTQEEADKLIAKYNETEFQGRTIRVNIAGQKTERPPRTSNTGGPGETELYIGSLAWETKDQDLETLFSKYGTIVSARVVMDRNDPTRSRGFAFIKVATLADAQEMVKNLDGA